jgi:hypothetical protein
LNGLHNRWYSLPHPSPTFTELFFLHAMNISSIRLVKALEVVMTEEVGRLIQWVYHEDWVDGA